MARMAWGAGLTTETPDGTTLDAWFRWFGWGEFGDDEMVAAHPDLDAQLGLRDQRDELRNVVVRPVRITVDVDQPPASAADAYKQAGVEDPREEISMAEVHDCFTPTELVLMEDLGFSPRGQAWRDTLDGRFALAGAQPVNPDGGLKSFGHPIGASGLRMMYEMWLQLRGEAGARQIDSPRTGLTHNLGGAPGRCVSFVSIVGG